MNKKVFIIASVLLIWVIAIHAQTYDQYSYPVYKKGYISLKKRRCTERQIPVFCGFEKNKVDHRHRNQNT